MKKMVLLFLLVCQSYQAVASSFVGGLGERPLLRRTQSAPLLPLTLPEENSPPSIEDQPERQTGSYFPSALKLAMRVGKSAGFALGMMTVYGQSLEKLEINLREGLFPLMAGTAVFYGLRDFLGPCFEEKNTAPVSWKLYSLLYSLLPVSLLLDAELSHHRFSGNQGWDGYFTYFMAIAPFILWAEFQDTLRLGRRYFLNLTGEAIRALDGYCDEEIREVYEDMETRGYYLPRPSLREAKRQSYFTSLVPVGLPLLNAPFSFIVYKSLLETLVGETFEGKEVLFSSLAALTMIASFMIEKEILLKERLTFFHLTGLLPGLFEAFPVLVQAYWASADWSAFFQVPLLIFFSSLKVMTYGAFNTHLIRNLVGRSPCYRDTPLQARLRLNTNLQQLYEKDL